MDTYVEVPGYKFIFSLRTEIKDETTLTHQADNQNLDDSADFSYGTKNLDSKSMEMFVENERSNFRLLLQRVCYLVSVTLSYEPVF